MRHVATEAASHCLILAQPTHQRNRRASSDFLSFDEGYRLGTYDIYKSQQIKIDTKKITKTKTDGVKTGSILHQKDKEAEAPPVPLMCWLGKYK